LVHGAPSAEAAFPFSRIAMQDRPKIDPGPGNITTLPPGHDASVVSDVTVVDVDWQAAPMGGRPSKGGTHSSNSADHTDAAAHECQPARRIISPPGPPPSAQDQSGLPRNHADISKLTTGQYQNGGALLTAALASGYSTVHGLREHYQTPRLPHYLVRRATCAPDMTVDHQCRRQDQINFT
jgi:hypothetical protein